MGPIVSNDVFWHLRMGQDWIENGLSPFVDHYSFTFLGHDIRQVPWLFQAGLYGFVSLFGEPLGLQIIRIAFFGFFALWFFIFLKAGRASTLVVVFGLVWLALALPLRSHVRPEIVSLLFAPIIISMALRCRERFEWRDILALFAVQWIWINIHASSMFGVVIVGALLIDRLIHFGLFERDYRAAGRMIGLGIALLGLTYLNRDFESVLVGYLLNHDGSTKLIREYNTVEYVQQEAFFRVYWVVAAIGLFAALFNRSWMTAIIVSVLGFQAWTAQRFGVPFVYITLPLLLLEMGRIHLNLRASVRHLALFCVAGVTLWCAREIVSAGNVVSLAGTSIQTHKFPVALVDRMKGEQLYGPTLVDYDVAGYVLYRLAPDVRVFIDGRTNILYPSDFFEFYYQARYQLEYFKAAHRLYQIDQILTVSDWYTGARMIQTAIRSGRYYIAYDDGRFSLLRQGNGHFVLSSRLNADPRCWKTRQSDGVAAELELAKERKLSGQSKVVGLLKFAEAFESAADAKAFLGQPKRWWWANSTIMRLAIYLSAVNGLYDESLPFFGPLLDCKDAHDRLYLVHSLVRLKKHGMAAAYFEEIDGNLLAEFRDLIEMYYALGRELSGLDKLSESDAASLAKLKEEHGLVGDASFLDVVGRVPEFCR